MEPTHTCKWLIEMQGPAYLAVRKLDGYEFYWTEAHDEALGFIDRAQADLTMMAVRQLRGDLFPACLTRSPCAVEHLWTFTEYGELGDKAVIVLTEAEADAIVRLLQESKKPLLAAPQSDRLPEAPHDDLAWERVLDLRAVPHDLRADFTEVWLKAYAFDVDGVSCKWCGGNPNDHDHSCPMELINRLRAEVAARRPIRRHRGR